MNNPNCKQCGGKTTRLLDENIILCTECDYEENDMTHEELVNWLIQNDINDISTGNINDYLDTILREGFIGYNNQTLKELQQEYNERQ